MEEKIHTTLSSVTHAIGIISRTIDILMTGDRINFLARAISKIYLLRKSSDQYPELSQSLSPRPPVRYDDRYYGREEQYYGARDPAYDTRYNSNYNSYRGNGKHAQHCITNSSSVLTT